MGPLHHLCSLVALLVLVAVRETVSSTDDQCQFIFKEDTVLDVKLSQDKGAKVTGDLHVEDKFKCAEECCSSDGEWCTLAVFHTQTGPEQKNCFLVQCVPDDSTLNVCITKHLRHSGFVTAQVSHPSTTTSPPPPTPPASTPSVPSPNLHVSPSITPEAPNASTPTLAPTSSHAASSNPPASSNPATSSSSSDAISANDTAEALNNLNDAIINASLTSSSSNPAPTSVTPSSPASATDIPNHVKPTTVKATTKATTKATVKATTKATTIATVKATTRAKVANTTPTPKWNSPASLPANQTSDSNSTQPITAAQSGQDGTKSPDEIREGNINRTTVTQTGILIVTLCFGIIFLLAMMVVIGKRWCEAYQKRKYSKVDYLINGIYS